MDTQEREEIINEAVERALLKIPEIIGNLMMYYSGKMKVSKRLYERFPEFEKHRQLVASTIEAEENADFSRSFDEIVEAAIPKIKRRIESVGNLDIANVKRPDLDFGQGKF